MSPRRGSGLSGTPRVGGRGVLYDSATGIKLNDHQVGLLADIYYNGGVPQLVTQFNVSGIVDDGQGLVTVSFLAGFDNNAYVALALTCGTTNTYVHINAKQGSSVQFEVVNENGTPVDPQGLMVTIIGGMK